MTVVMIHSVKYMTTVIINQAGPAVTIKRAATKDTEAVVAMLGRTSRLALFHRFHGWTDGEAFTRAALSKRLGVVNALAWSGTTCVGMATLALDPRGFFDVGVLVEDAWQRAGVATALLRTLFGWAVADGVEEVHADVMDENRYVIGLLKKFGPVTATPRYGGYSVTVKLHVYGYVAVA
jgi:GNAT superfamily N-acetyltransferase